MQFLQAEEGTGTESIFISKYLSPNCVGHNTVTVLYNLTDMLSTYKTNTHLYKLVKRSMSREVWGILKAGPLDRDRNTVPESGETGGRVQAAG